MKRFMMFAYNDYYPAGGMNDFVLDFDWPKDAYDFILEVSRFPTDFHEDNNICFLLNGVENINLFDLKEKTMLKDWEMSIRKSFDGKIWKRFVSFKDRTVQERQWISEANS